MSLLVYSFSRLYGACRSCQPQHVRLPHLGLHFGDAAGLGRRFALPDCVPLSQISNLIKLQPMKVTITPAMLASAKTDAGGYTRAQMDVFGVDWPPPKGWPSFLIGQVVEKEKFDQFMEARLVMSKARKQQIKQNSLF